MTREQNIEYLGKLAKLIRYYILYAVKEADSGHTTTALSSVELMTTLFFAFLRQDLDDLDMPNNDRVVFSKGHASPLIYSLYAAAGRLTKEDLAGFRSVESPLEGHPTYRFPYTEVPTGSLGQGLSVGLGLAYNAKYFAKLPYRTYVLMGDGEVAEGQVWEAFALASHYNLSNVTAIVDVNRLGQTVETQYGWDTDKYERRLKAFGWATRSIDGHCLPEVMDAFDWAQSTDQPSIIFARTLKGKGVALWENMNGWHSKPIPKDRFEEAVRALGDIDFSIIGRIAKPVRREPASVATPQEVPEPVYEADDRVPTKLAFGRAITRLAPKYPNVLVLDGDVQNSTHAELFGAKYPDRFIECFIAEQNMVSMAQGLALRHKQPFIVTFAAFLTRAFDQFRMSALGDSPLRVVGSYVGASIGKDGPSNMGMEDIGMFRAIHGSTVLYPADAISTERLTETMVNHSSGLIYLRTSREPLPNLYSSADVFPIGGSKTLRLSTSDALTIVAAGVTLYEALSVYDMCQRDGVNIRVVDCYSIKPIDGAGLKAAARESKGKVLVVEDHWFDCGIGDAVLNVFATSPGVCVHRIAVTRRPVSGEPRDVMRYVGIDATSVYQRSREIIVDM